MNVFEVFDQDVAESVCEYNVGSMEKGDGQSFDLDDAHGLLRALSRLESGRALIVVRKD